MKPTPPAPDPAVERRRQLAAQRLARYDHEAAVLVAYLRAVASRIEAGTVADTDAESDTRPVARVAGISCLGSGGADGDGAGADEKDGCGCGNRATGSHGASYLRVRESHPHVAG